MDVGVEQLEHALTLEGDGAGQELVSHGRQGVGVGGRTDGGAHHLLRRHVGRRSRGHATDRLDGSRLEQLGQPEVGQDRVAARVDQHVGRLDVTMDHALAVRVVESGADAFQEEERGLPVEALTSLEAIAQGAAGHVFDDHVGRSLELTEVVDVEYVRVAHLGDRLGLAAEAGGGVGVGSEHAQDLDGGRPGQGQVVGAVDGPHRPLPEQLLHLVGAEVRPRLDRHWRGGDYRPSR